MTERFVRKTWGKYSAIFALLGALVIVDGVLVPADTSLFTELLTVTALVMILPCMKCILVWHRHHTSGKKHHS